jgi:hypothetical protein
LVNFVNSQLLTAYVHFLLVREMNNFISQPSLIRNRLTLVDVYTMKSSLADTPSNQNLSQLENIKAIKVYSGFQVGLASFLGTPIAAAILMATNFFHFGEAGKARVTLSTGVLITFLIVVICFLPSFRALIETINIPSSFIPIMYTLIILGCYDYLQKAKVSHLLQSGGKRHSYWRVSGAIVIGLVSVTGVFVISFLIINSIDPNILEN